MGLSKWLFDPIKKIGAKRQHKIREKTYIGGSSLNQWSATFDNMGININNSNWSSATYVRNAIEAYNTCAFSFTCIRMIAKSIADIPLVIKSTRDDKIIKGTDLEKLLKRPNATTSGSKFMQALVTYNYLSGDSYVVDSTNGQGKPQFLYLLRPDYVTPVVENGVLIKYQYTTLSGVKEFTVDHVNGKSEIMNWSEFNPLDEVNGMPQVTASQKAIMLQNSSMRWNEALFKNSARPSGILSYKDEYGRGMTADVKTLTEQALKANQTGVSKAGELMLLPTDLKYQQVSQTNKDMDFIASQDQNARQIALVLGVPVQLMGIDTTYSNLKEAKEVFYTDTLIPVLSEILDELNIWLAPRFGDVYIDMDTSGLDALVNQRAKMLEMYNNSDATTTNERRRLLGLEDAKKGDTIFVDSGKVPLEIASEYIPQDYNTDSALLVGEGIPVEDADELGEVPLGDEAMVDEKK